MLLIKSFEFRNAQKTNTKANTSNMYGKYFDMLLIAFVALLALCAVLLTTLLAPRTASIAASREKTPSRVK